MDRISLNYQSLILILTVFQAGFYSMFLLLGRNRHRVSSRLLGCVTLVLALHFLNVLLTEFGPFVGQPNFNPVFGFLYGPLLLLFVRSLIRPHFTMRGTAGHFIAPAVTPFLVGILSTYGSPGYGLISVAVLIHLSTYLLVAKRTLISFNRDLQDHFSAIDKVNLDWLSRLLNQMLFIVGVTIVHFIVQTMGFETAASILANLIFLSVLYFINALVLKGMSHPSIDVWIDTVAPGSEAEAIFGSETNANGRTGRTSLDQSEAGEDEERYRDSGLSLEESQSHFVRLREVMERDEPYLDENLSLRRLAGVLEISPKHLSQVINQNAGQNFYDFINRYRIEKAKSLLLDPERTDLRVSEVMYEVGYAAKSTFNGLFKRFTGMTPTEFRTKKGPNS